MNYEWMVKQIDTNNTPLTFRALSHDVGAHEKFYNFFKKQGLTTVNDFFALSGQIVDRNRRSEVHKITLGVPPKTFFLKLHHNFLKRRKFNPFIKEPMILRELKNMALYLKAGISVPLPAAWGVKLDGKEVLSFLITPELENFQSLKVIVESEAFLQNRNIREQVSKSIASTLAKMHKAGLAHIDLFSWHIFVKIGAGKVKVAIIDLERTKQQSKLPFLASNFYKRTMDDLAALNLTVPWPQVSNSMRLRFFNTYISEGGFEQIKYKLIWYILKRSCHRGKKSKFAYYKVAQRLGVLED